MSDIELIEWLNKFVGSWGNDADKKIAQEIIRRLKGAQKDNSVSRS